MQSLVATTTGTLKPLFFHLQNPFSALLRSLSSAVANPQPVATRQHLEYMARDVESLQPNLAAELRSFACRS